MCNLFVNTGSAGFAEHDPLSPIDRQLSSEDPRVALRLRIEVRDKVIKAIEARLAQNPDDQHQLFILEEHQKAQTRMLDELRQLQLATDPRYQNLDAYVSDYVQALDNEPSALAEVSPAQSEALAELAREQQTWQEMIDKVRLRLTKRPGDPQLMRLLAEHQARLLKVSESRHALLSGQDPNLAQGDQLVLASLAAPAKPLAPAAQPALSESPVGGLSASADLAPTEPEAAPESAPEPAARSEKLSGLLREREVFVGMVEKTRQRLAAKPELIHLKALIQQHEARIRELDVLIDELDS